MSEFNEEVVVDFDDTVKYIHTKLIESNVTVPKEIIGLILELETDYLTELGLISYGE